MPKAKFLNLLRTAQIHAGLETGTVGFFLQEIEHRLLMPDDSVKYIRRCCETIYNAKGTPLRSVGTLQDITERKRAEGQVKEHLAELRRWHQATQERETRIRDLVHDVNNALTQAGMPPRYSSVEKE